MIALLDKREDRAEKKKLDAERLKFEEEKKKFEEEKMKFEEYKKQFPQKAVVVEAEKKETMPALIASKIDTAEKHVSLFEKVINAPTKAEQIVKTIQENAQVVDKRLEKFDTFKKVKNFIVSCGTGAIMFFKDEIKEFTGLRAGDSSEGSIGGESNGMSNEGKSGGPVPKAVAAANGAVNGATSVPKVGSAGIDSGAPGAGGVTGADSAIGAGVDSGAGGGVSAPGAGGADSTTGARGANSVTGARGATGAPAGAGPKGE